MYINAIQDRGGIYRVCKFRRVFLYFICNVFKSRGAIGKLRRGFYFFFFKVLKKLYVQ